MSAPRNHRLDMLINELTRPRDPLTITVEHLPTHIVLAGLAMYRVMPGLPPDAEVIDLSAHEPVEMPECTIEPPLYAGDPMGADPEYAAWDEIEERYPDLDDEAWGADLRARMLDELRGAQT